MVHTRGDGRDTAPLPAVNWLGLRDVVLQLLLTFVLQSFKGTGWLVPNVFFLLAALSDPYALRPIHFVHTLPAFTPAFKQQFHITILVSLSSNMHSYTSRCSRSCRLHSIPRLFCSCPVCSCFSTPLTTRIFLGRANSRPAVRSTLVSEII